MKRLRTVLYIAIITTAACSKSSGGGNNGGGGNTNPSVSASALAVTVSRQDTNSQAKFLITLSATSTNSVSVNYATSDGSAKAGTDYVAATGTLTIPAGSRSGSFNVTILGDSLRQNTQTFLVTLSNAVNCTLSTDTASGIIFNDGTYLPTDSSGYTTPTSYPGYNLVWHDEFDSSALRAQNWTPEINGSGEGNAELEYYTGRVQNLFVSQGNLVIEARQESYSGSNYTSARIDSYNKESFTYGRIDIRAKLPVSTGMWPALWMLGNNINTGTAWPACGEMDIMELIGTYPSRVTGSIHWEQAGNTEGTFNNSWNLPSGDFSQAFHVFSEIWTADSVTYLVDDNVYVQASYQANVTSGVNPFNSPFFFIFNVAVGGNWPGPPSSSTVFPQRMFVDYVRVFQKN
jgi:beta-glucanase (GH16 family)